MSHDHARNWLPMKLKLLNFFNRSHTYTCKELTLCKEFCFIHLLHYGSIFYDSLDALTLVVFGYYSIVIAKDNL